MVGGTLNELRERIADRHEDGGRYYVSCARTGERPVPVAGKRFATRETAAEAAELATEYRAELRRYDPRLPHYDLVVTEDPGPGSSTRPMPKVEASADATTVSDFCHDVAAAVFESLSELGETAVERAVLEAYLHSAESVTDPDELCLVLLSTTASELDARLAPDRQGEVLRAAADRLGRPTGPGASADGTDPVDAALERLDALSLVGDYGVARNRSATASDTDDRREAQSDDRFAGRSWTVSVEGYAFDTVNGCVPTLPFAVELLRGLPGETVAVSDLRRTGNSGWECVVSTATESTRAVTLATPENA
jgi:hypothetical protein